MPIGAAKLGVLGAGLVPGGTETFNAPGTFSIPPGVKKVSITGTGGSGNPGNSGNAGTAGTNGIGGGGGSGGSGQATEVALGGYGGGIYTTFGPGNWTAVRGGVQANPGPTPIAGGPGPAGPAGSGGSAGSAGSAGNAGQASSGLGNNFPGGAGGNAGNAGNAGTGGGAGPGGTGANGRGPLGAGNGGAGGTGGGAGSPGGTVRPGAICLIPVPQRPFICNTLGGGGGGGAGATNDGQPGKDSNNIPRAIFQQQSGDGPPSYRGGMGGTTSCFSVTIATAANFNVPCAGSNTSGGMGGGFGNCVATNCGGRINYYPGSYVFGGRTCASRQPVQAAGGGPDTSAGLQNNAYRFTEGRTGNPTPGNQPQYPMQNLGLTRTNNVVRSGGGGGGGVGSSPNSKPDGAGGGGGGGGRGGAGNAGGAGGAGGTGGAGTPQTFNCVPVTPGGTTPITVASPGGQIVISWNPQ